MLLEVARLNTEIWSPGGTLIEKPWILGCGFTESLGTIKYLCCHQDSKIRLMTHRNANSQRMESSRMQGFDNG